ncbi:MAG: CAP domain-containing protein [Chloroflexota bacterium]|nr:CAP domain-containing protein [Chloroflexota bacterium]
MARAGFGLGWGVVVLTLLALASLGGSPSRAQAASDTPTPAPASATPASSGLSEGASVTPSASSADGSGDPFREREDRLALMIGRARAGAGLLPLARSAALDRAAAVHAQDMVDRGYMEHDAPDGSTPGSRAAQEGYDTTPGGAWMVVEVISAMGDEPDGPLGWWLSDGLHRRVVLRPPWRELGVGFAPGGPYGRFWVALFGCRPGVLPPVLLDGVLAIPDEGCGRGPDAFGPVQSVRAADTNTAAHGLDWEPYTAQRPWPGGHTAVVDMRDAAGHELETRAADPTGAASQAP